LQADM